jgi:hypothetical protein
MIEAYCKYFKCLFKLPVPKLYCKVCEMLVVPEGAGSQQRNHCPKCLSSVHLDNEPGDRA